MKIVHYDVDTLILRPGGAGLIILFGLAFAIAGIFMIGWLGTVNRLVCERASRAQMQCQLERTLFNIPLETKELVGLRGARLYTNEDSDGDTYKVTLITAAGEQPLTNYASSGYRAQQRIVEDVNLFVQSPNLSHLDVAYGGGNQLWFGALFFLIGAVVSVVGVQARFTTWTFDRYQSLVVHRRETLRGVKVNEYALRDITNARVTHSRDSDGDTTYRVELETRAGETIPLTRWYSSGHKNKERAAEAIRAFLQI